MPYNYFRHVVPSKKQQKDEDEDVFHGFCLLLRWDNAINADMFVNPSAWYQLLSWALGLARAGAPGALALAADGGLGRNLRGQCQGCPMMSHLTGFRQGTWWWNWAIHEPKNWVVVPNGVLLSSFRRSTFLCRFPRHVSSGAGLGFAVTSGAGDERKSYIYTYIYIYV